MDKKYSTLVVQRVSCQDIRFPTAKSGMGSDAVHKDPNYSSAYVTISIVDTTNPGRCAELPLGRATIFTIGRGNELCQSCVYLMAHMVEGMCVGEIFNNFRGVWRKITNHHQLRWVGPEKGVSHIAVAGIINALWDLWGKLEKKPVWRLLCDLTPEQLVRCCDFRYVTDFLTEKEAIKILKDKWSTRKARIKSIEKKGFPGYTTGCSWSGYSD